MNFRLCNDLDLNGLLSKLNTPHKLYRCTFELESPANGM